MDSTKKIKKDSINVKEDKDLKIKLGLLNDSYFQLEKTDSKLRQVGMLFQRLFNLAVDPTVVHLISKDGKPSKFIMVNDSFCKVLGYTREEALKLEPKDIEASTHQNVLKNNLKKLLKNKHLVFETKHITKDGHEIDVEISSVIFKFNDSTAILAMARNISDRKLSEYQLKESEEKYRMLSEKSKAVTMLTSADGKVNFISPDRKSTRLNSSH